MSPAVNHEPGQWLKDKIHGFEARLKALEWPSGWHIMDTTNVIRVSAGINADGTTAFRVFDHAAVLRLSAGQQLDGTTDLRVFDNAGNARTNLRQLSSGDYGLSVTDPLGNTSEICPTQAALVNNSESTTSTAFTNLATYGPSVTSYIGASGKALVFFGAFVQVPAGTAGNVGVSIDGSTPTTSLSAAFGINATTGGAASVASFNIATGLSPGSHTFVLQYKNSGGTITYATRAITVIPI
jgi:hypothetical protein